MRAEAGRAPTGSGFEVVVIVVCGAAFGLGGVVFAGAWLATRLTGGWVSGDLTVWWSVVAAMVHEPGDPAAAWADHASGVPGPVLYWVCTALAAVAMGVVAWLVWRLWRLTASPDRMRFGVDTDARQARRADVATLKVSSAEPSEGRLLLGRMAPNGPLLATEDRDRDPVSGKAARRQGSRGSVALIGPTQAGKTALLSSGMISWKGPVIALSVKREGLPRVGVTSEMACPEGRPERMSRCPSPIPRSFVTTS